MPPPRPGHLHTQLPRQRTRFGLATAIAAFLVVDVAMRTFGAPPSLAAAVRALTSGDTPMIATGASFSVSAGSFATRDRADAFASALNASDLPILVRVRPEDGRYQVLVGPYVSTDEAERAQRALARWGLGDARLVVDDTMRGTPQRAAVFGIGDVSARGASRDAVLIVAAVGMSSVVFEMHTAPQEVEARRTSATTIDVDIGRVTRVGRTDPLSMPEGVVLARSVFIAPAEIDGAMRAHLVVPEGVRSRVRLEGRRVYVDLAWPQPPWQVDGRAMPVTQRALASPQVDASDACRQQLDAAWVRFEQIEPFLISAVESPQPEILSALAHSLSGVRDSLAAVIAPPELEANRQSMMSSLVEVSRALGPSFDGDRGSAVRHAISMFEDARK